MRREPPRTQFLKETSTFLSLVLTGDILAALFGWLEVVCESRRVGVAKVEFIDGKARPSDKLDIRLDTSNFRGKETGVNSRYRSSLFRET